MGVQEEFVERVVRMQVSSPSFAEYCVAHVTDPKHRFLFTTDDSSEERRLYLRLLQEQQQQQQQPRGNPEAKEPLPASYSMRSVPWKRRGSTAALWLALRDYFASPRMVRGPHMPHMFRTEQELAAFLDMLESVQHDSGRRSNTVQHMVRRLPMTETFLHTICYMCETYVGEARKLMSPPHRGALSISPSQTAASAAASGDNALQKGGTLLFVANMLLMEHELLEGKPRYLAPFEFYMERMVEGLAKAAPGDSQVTLFLRQTVEAWAAGDLLSRATLTRMMQAVGAASCGA